MPGRAVECKGKACVTTRRTQRVLQQHGGKFGTVTPQFATDKHHIPYRSCHDSLQLPSEAFDLQHHA